MGMCGAVTIPGIRCVPAVQSLFAEGSEARVGGVFLMPLPCGLVWLGGCVSSGGPCEGETETYTPMKSPRTNQ